MTKKQIKSEFPNEVDILRTTLAELKAKLPGLDTFLLANQECTKCSNSKDYQCVQLKGKPGCRTCTTRRISCSRHVQYLVETAASRLEWSVEKTKSMYDKYVKQTRNGKKSPSKVKRVRIRKTVDAPQKFASGSAADQRKEMRGMAASEQGDHEGDGGSEFQDGAQQAPEDLEDFSDELEEDDEDDEDSDWDGGADGSIRSIPKVMLRTTLSNARAFPTDHKDEVPTSRQQATVPALESEPSTSLYPGLHDSISLRTDPEKTASVKRVDDSPQPIQPMDEHSRVPAEAPGAESEHPQELNMSAEQRIKQLEKEVAKLNILRLADAASISRLTKKADTAFDNMSVLLSRIRIHRQELDANVTKHIEPAHQKHFKSVIAKMDETSVSATQILMLLDKRKKYVVPKTRVPVIITDEEGQEWVPWDVVSDDNDLQDDEEERKRRRDDGGDSLTGEVSSKRRKL